MARGRATTGTGRRRPAPDLRRTTARAYTLHVAEEPAQHRWTQRFVDAEVEARYHAERTPAARRRMRAVLPPLVALWCGAFWFDLTAPAEMGARNTVIRFAVGAPPFLFATLF